MKKRNNELRFSKLEIRKADSNEIEFVISSDKVDSYNTFVDLDSFDYKQRPKLCIDHDIRVENTIGVCTDIRREDNLIIGIFKKLENDELTEKIFNRLEQGILTDVSIGFSIEKTENVIIDKREVLKMIGVKCREVSVVVAGANPDAKKRSLGIEIKATPEEISNQRKERLKIYTEFANEIRAILGTQSLTSERATLDEMKKAIKLKFTDEITLSNDIRKNSDEQNFKPLLTDEQREAASLEFLRKKSVVRFTARNSNS